MPIHEQVSIHTPWDDSEVRVDESIAQLISALWADGMRTKYSCEGFLTHDPSGYIAFHHRRHAVRFARRTRAVAEVSVDPPGFLILRFNPWCAVRFRAEDLHAITEYWANTDA